MEYINFDTQKISKACETDGIKNYVNSYEQTQQIDSFDEILRLERQHMALDFIQEQLQGPSLDERSRALAPLVSPRHAVDQINNQFARRILPAFLQANYENALQQFRETEPHTADQEMVLLINNREFLDIHQQLHRYLQCNEDSMQHAASERLLPTGQIQWNDTYQFKDTTKRSLETIEKDGIKVTLDKDALPKVVAAYEASKDTHLPLIEVLKNERIVTISGFSDSKVSHIVHDAMDHTWGFQLLRDSGLYAKYQDMFEAIGDPMNTDIFKREGEIISSIGFGVRYGSIQENGFRPLISNDDITRLFDQLAADNKLDERHERAHEILYNLTPNSREGLSLGFTFSNYITELDEQRRKHGKIKTRDKKTGLATGELDEFSPDFMSLFIELHHEILSSNNKHRDNLFRFHILLEEYLTSIACGDMNIGEDFIVHIQDIDKYDYSKTPIESGKLRWMFKNYGFAATKESLI